MARLEKWKRTVDPIRGHDCLFGVVTGHPVLSDGECYTTELRELDLEHNIAVTKSGTIYELGAPADRVPDEFHMPGCPARKGK